MAHPDLDALLNALIPFAQDQIKKRAGFLPFGATMKVEGSISLVAGYTDKPDATPQDMISLIEGGFRQAASLGEVRAVGLCLDGRVVPPGQAAKTDAICCSLEHSGGETIQVYLPYKKGFLGRIKYGELFAVPATPSTFTPDGSSDALS